MTRRHWRVRREDASGTNGLDLLGGSGGSGGGSGSGSGSRGRGAGGRGRSCSRVTGSGLEQAQREERSVTFVHMERDESGVTERLQHGHAADPEHGLLSEPVLGVATVELIGDRTVACGVLRQVGVEEQDGDAAPGHSRQHEPPSRHGHRTATDIDGHGRLEALQEVTRIPADRQLALVTVSVDLLAEVAVSVPERQPDEGQVQVGSRAQEVARQHAQPAAVGGQRRVEGHLHREVRHLHVRNLRRRLIGQPGWGNAVGS
jgi:hypothetical protein